MRFCIERVLLTLALLVETSKGEWVDSKRQRVESKLDNSYRPKKSASSLSQTEKLDADFWRILVDEVASYPTAAPTRQPPTAPIETNSPTSQPAGSGIGATATPTVMVDDLTSTPTVAPATSDPTTVPSAILPSPTKAPVTPNEGAETVSPTASQTSSPTAAPVTAAPVTPNEGAETVSPTASLTSSPTAAPVTAAPVNPETPLPTLITFSPTKGETPAPFGDFTASPTTAPVTSITPAPTAGTTASPTQTPTSLPVVDPTAPPTNVPTALATTASPTGAPTALLTIAPTATPTAQPVDQTPTIQVRLTPFALQGGVEFEDPTAYQSRAVAKTEAQTGIESASDAKLTQYYALYCIYEATNGVSNPITDNDPRIVGPVPGWKLSSGWAENSADPCEWHGIECDGDAVVSVELVDNILTGRFPPEVSLLASDGERSTGAGKLQKLDLFNNPFLFNDFDNSWITFLGSDMQYLYFQATGFAGTIPQLPSGLVELDASYTLIEGPLNGANFVGKDSLNWMLLDGNAFNSSIPNEFASLPNLQYLYIGDAFITGDLSYMEGMPSIVEHWVDINPGLTGPIPAAVGGLSTLGSFSASQCSFTGTLPTELGQLSNMIQMWLYGNQIGGQIPSELGQIGTMKILQLEGNEFVGSMPDEICAQIGFLKPLEILGADCDDADFTCSCCTCCSLGGCNPDLAR